jgi:Ni/Co efflux regulator RcnB
MKARYIFIATIAASLMASPLVMAQAQQQQQERQQQMPPQQDTVDVDERELKQFAEAYVEVEEVREEYSEKLRKTDDQQEALALQEEANEEMTAAIEGSGLDHRDYQEIEIAITRDPDLRDRLDEMVADLR